MPRRVTPDDGFEALLEPFYNGKSLTDPISTKEDKYQLLPAFLKVKGKKQSSGSECVLAPASPSSLLTLPLRPDQTAYRLLQLLHRA